MRGDAGEQTQDLDRVGSGGRGRPCDWPGCGPVRPLLAKANKRQAGVAASLLVRLSQLANHNRQNNGLDDNPSHHHQPLDHPPLLDQPLGPHA